MRRHRTIYFNDARHYYLFVYDPPMRLEDAWVPVDEVAETSVDTFSYGVSRADGLFYPSKVGAALPGVSPHDRAPGHRQTAELDARVRFPGIDGTDVLRLPERDLRRLAARPEPGRLYRIQRTPARGADQCGLGPAGRVARIRRGQRRVPLRTGKPQGELPDPEESDHQYRSAPGLQTAPEGRRCPLFGGVAHGTTAWRSDWMRRTTIQFMGSGNVALPPGKKGAGWRWSSDPNNPARPVPDTG